MMPSGGGQPAHLGRCHMWNSLWHCQAAETALHILSITVLTIIINNNTAVEIMLQMNSCTAVYIRVIHN